MSDVSLDESQLAAVEIEPDERQIVIAGPGSGKTEVVAALIEHLTDEMGVDPVHELLVISFSNAAVSAAEGRLKAHGSAPVSVRTMDSLAAEILRDLATQDYSELDFDGRVAAATHLLTANGWDRIGDLVHLIVDEVQDIVGVRADFLKSVVGAMSLVAGFSLLGDPAQGIYDFQLRQTGRGSKTKSTTTSAQLLESIRASHAPTLRKLSGQYRASSRDSHAAMRLRDAVLPDGNVADLEAFFADLVHLGPIAEAMDLLSTWQGSTALLTATNGQALAAAGALRASGVTAEIRRSAQHQVAARWISTTLGDSSTDSVTKIDFEKLVSTRLPDLDSSAAWRALRGLLGARGTEIRISAIASRLSAGHRLVPDLEQRPAADVVVSTVHRAKGLEFDNVVLLDFGTYGRTAEDVAVAEALRTQFVALTRARILIVRADGPDIRDLRLTTNLASQRTRWYLGGHKPWMTFGFEIGIGDTEPMFDDPELSQAHIGANVTAGDPLLFRLDIRASTLDVPIYEVVHSGVTIARTSRAFGEDLAARVGTLKRRRGTWPRLDGAKAEAITTTASDPRPGSAWRHGLYLAPVVTGLLTIQWNGTAE